MARTSFIRGIRHPGHRVQRSSWKVRAAKARQKLQEMTYMAILLFATAETEEEEDAAMLISCLILQEEEAINNIRRYGTRGPYRRDLVGGLYKIMMSSFSERQFKVWMRMDRTTFLYVLDLIKNDPIFVSNNPLSPQRPVSHQLATFLCRVGNENALKSSTVMGVSEGTVYNYVARVTQAFLNIQHDHLGWPNNDRRDFFASYCETQGFPGCIGSGDGCLFRLADRPNKHGTGYFCRKHFYALNVQAIVNPKAIFTSYDMGWPGSAQDSRVFRASLLFRERHRHFRDHEYILVDKGYPLTPFSIRPFTEKELKSEPDVEQRRVKKRWNARLSHVRIASEHAFGRLKGRFPLLKEIHGKDIERMLHLIRALMILHNILEERGISPDSIAGQNGVDDGDGEEDEECVNEEFRAWAEDQEGAIPGIDVDADLYKMGLYRRKLLVELMQQEEEDN